MARFTNSDNNASVSAHPVKNNSMQAQEIVVSSSNANKVQVPSHQIERIKAKQFWSRFFKIICYLHLILVAALVIFLTIRGILSASKHGFDSKKWYFPVLASTGCAGIVSFLCHCLTNCCSSKAVPIAFWLSPLLVLGVGMLHLTIGSAGGLGIGILAIIVAIVQSLYLCWVTPRFHYAIKIFSVSNSFKPAGSTAYVSLTIIISTLYFCFLVAGIGGASASHTSLDILFVFFILLSLAWTSQIIKNVLQVTVSQVKYMHFAYGREMDTRKAFCDTIRHLLGSICIGSIIVPIIVVIKGSARALNLIAGGSDEFLFSCVDCYSGIGSTLIANGNRWGFVHLGVYDKGFVQASKDVWEMFKRSGMESLIDMDLTGSFCFFCGIICGAVCSLVGGCWEFVVNKSYTTEVSIYAFLIGYFMCRAAMAWAQGSISAIYVAYAEHPGSPLFDSTIPARIQEIERSHV